MIRDRRGVRPGRRAGHRLQRPLRRTRPVRGRAARAGRGLPQRRGDRGRTAGRHELPQLRLAGGPGGHVAVRAGRRRGLADACQELGIPVTGGNVSFYNQTGEVAIHPTPVVGVLGVIDDVARRTPMAWRPGRGARSTCWGETRTSSAARGGPTLQGHLGGLPPAVDLQASGCSAEILVAGSRDGMLTAAHDVCRRRGRPGPRGDVAARWHRAPALGCPTVRPVHVPVQRVRRAGDRGGAAQRGVAVHRDVRSASFPRERIGVVDSGLGPVLQVGDHFTVGIGEMRECSETVLPSHFA